MVSRTKKDLHRQAVAVEVGGQVYTGTAHMEPGGIIVVNSGHGEKVTQLGELPFEFLAKQLLKELVKESKT